MRTRYAQAEVRKPLTERLNGRLRSRRGRRHLITLGTSTSQAANAKDGPPPMEGTERGGARSAHRSGQVGTIRTIRGRNRAGRAGSSGALHYGHPPLAADTAEGASLTNKVMALATKLGNTWGTSGAHGAP